MKKILLNLFIVLTLLSNSFPAFAEDIKPIEITVDSTTLNLDTQPITINDRTLVPLRAIFEALGAKVDWNDQTQTVTSIKDSVTIIIQVNSTTAKVNGETKILDAAPIITNDRVLVPIRFISENFGAKVDWNETDKSIKITSKAVLDKIAEQAAAKEKLAEPYNLKYDTLITEEELKNNDVLVIENTIDTKTSYYLPRKIIVNVDGINKELSVTWDEKNKVNTYKTGLHTYNGKLKDYDKNVQLKLNIITYQLDKAIDQYKTKSSDHFILYYTDNDSVIINDFIIQLESNYSRITSFLNVQMPQKIRVDLYPNRSEYKKILKSRYPNLDIPDNNSGEAINSTHLDMISPIMNGAVITTYDHMIEVAVHEFTHCVVKAANSNANLPRWFNEGIAVYTSGQNPAKVDINEIPSIADMNTSFSTNVYTYAGYIVRYIVETYGADKLNQMIRNGGNLSALGVSEYQFQLDYTKYIQSIMK